MRSSFLITVQNKVYIALTWQYKAFKGHLNFSSCDDHKENLQLTLCCHREEAKKLPTHPSRQLSNPKLAIASLPKSYQSYTGSIATFKGILLKKYIKIVLCIKKKTNNTKQVSSLQRFACLTYCSESWKNSRKIVLFKTCMLTLLLRM